MIDVSGLSKAIQNAAFDVVDYTKPSDIVKGVVTSTAPLIIWVNQKLSLSASQLIMTRNVIDFDVLVSINGAEERVCTIRNGLVVNDIVIMVSAQGGQKFVVLDKVYKGKVVSD